MTTTKQMAIDQDVLPHEAPPAPPSFRSILTTAGHGAKKRTRAYYGRVSSITPVSIGVPSAGMVRVCSVFFGSEYFP